MDSFIKYEEKVIKQLTCNHPQVKKIWEWGGGSALGNTGLYVAYVSIMLNDGTRTDFDTLDGKGIEKAEQYLRTIAI